MTPLLILLACRGGPTETETAPISDTEPGADTDPTAHTDADSDGHTDPRDTDVDTDPGDTDRPSGSVRIAVIGDYGNVGQTTADVAALVASWSPDVVITTGDNNYGGSLETIDENIGQYYHAFIHPYGGVYGAGAAENRFFPSLGNADWSQAGAWPYIYWFELPGKEYYYDTVQGPVHLFALDSDGDEPDGTTYDSVQGKWLQAALAASDAPWKVVYFHHAPYSSGGRSASDLQWPFAAWGADVVLAGHDHVYERLEVDGIPYVVQGLGGSGIYEFSSLLAATQVQYNADYAATFIDADDDSFVLTTQSRAGVTVDRYALGEPEPALTTLLPAGSSWRYLDGGADPGPSWASPGFDDSAWAAGPAPLGYGDAGLGTEVGYGGDAAAKPITTWFRATFEVVDAAALAELHLGLACDDGCVVWLNGAEILRSGIAPGAHDASTLAWRDMERDSELVFQPAWLPATALVTGTNTLAVEVHQASASSSDLRLDVVLAAR